MYRSISTCKAETEFSSQSILSSFFPTYTPLSPWERFFFLDIERTKRMVKNLFMLVSFHVETMKKRKKNYFSVPSNIAKQEDKLHKNIQQ